MKQILCRAAALEEGYEGADLIHQTPSISQALLSMPAAYEHPLTVQISPQNRGQMPRISRPSSESNSEH